MIGPTKLSKGGRMNHAEGLKGSIYATVVSINVCKVQYSSVARR